MENPQPPSPTYIMIGWESGTVFLCVCFIPLKLAAAPGFGAQILQPP